MKRSHMYCFRMCLSFTASHAETVGSMGLIFLHEDRPWLWKNTFLEIKVKIRQVEKCVLMSHFHLREVRYCQHGKVGYYWQLANFAISHRMPYGLIPSCYQVTSVIGNLPIAIFHCFCHFFDRGQHGAGQEWVGPCHMSVTIGNLPIFLGSG